MENICLSTRCLTCVHVGAEGESAVLDVEGEGVDVEVAGANHSDWAEVVDPTIRMDMYKRHSWGCVLSHTVRQQQKHTCTQFEQCLHL